MFRNYIPLFVILGVCLLASLAINDGFYDLGGWMSNFMGMFFVLFSLFKLIDMPGFMRGLRKYDFIAQRYQPYAVIFPFFELVLGLCYLYFGSAVLLNLVTLCFAMLNAYSVTRALRRGLDVRCACLGTALNVPLSTISVLENGGMAIMALLMLFVG